CVYEISISDTVTEPRSSLTSRKNKITGTKKILAIVILLAKFKAFPPLPFIRIQHTCFEHSVCQYYLSKIHKLQIQIELSIAQHVHNCLRSEEHTSELQSR